ncbi:shikimate dehydrogenase [Rhizobium sp. RM]|uniref:shikimate dehydrogenase family protein n=1 Tax=Rhizobium sp. RM TaxID=2748079 RepID=UPI00110ED851|nr:shikimate dehydrogenase [Rhizobium sp. RM]NWJ25268.1 shikimate dehydrogenase [Rhizobium sp. RM]TMV17640.1 shikimate dehydrogenase [Rhizobium sp. Td3]
MEINGRTQVLVHIAYPSAHLRTPQLFNARCAERRLDAVLVPWQVHPDNLAGVMNALRVSESVPGAIITIPHKETVAALCDRLEGPAALLGVANVVRKEDDGALVGRILDGEGFTGGLSRTGRNPAGKRALLIGAGGVSVAIADALLASGIRELVISNRTESRANALVERLTPLYPAIPISVGKADGTGFDLVVNGTALGMHDNDPLPIDPATLERGTIVAEVIMSPPVTRLLQEARLRGATVHEGVHMLTGQIDPFIDFVVRNASGEHFSNIRREKA